LLANSKFLIPNSKFPLLWGALLAGVLLRQTIVRAARPDGIDLTSYLLSARALAHGASPYLLATPFPYLYPPTLAFLLIPLTLVPASAALVIWFGLNAGAAVWLVRRVAVAVRPELEQTPATLALFEAAFFTFFFPIVQSNLRNGQVNFLVLALCVAAALPSQLCCTRAGAPPARPGPHARPALLWSLATAIKVVPLVLLPWFALRRSRQWMLAAAIACPALLALPAVMTGGRIIDLYRQFAEVLRAASFGPQSATLDFSLAGTIAAITGAPATPALRVSSAAVVFGWILQADARRFRGECARPLVLYLLGIPLASPKSEVHHLAFMLPAAALTVLECCSRPRARSRATLITGLAAAVLYLIAVALPHANGPIYCAALMAMAAAVVQAPHGTVAGAAADEKPANP